MYVIHAIANAVDQSETAQRIQPEFEKMALLGIYAI
jgi:hypothetical protein